MSEDWKIPDYTNCRRWLLEPLKSTRTRNSTNTNTTSSSRIFCTSGPCEGHIQNPAKQPMKERTDGVEDPPPAHPALRIWPSTGRSMMPGSHSMWFGLQVAVLISTPITAVQRNMWGPGVVMHTVVTFLEVENAIYEGFCVVCGRKLSSWRYIVLQTSELT